MDILIRPSISSDIPHIIAAFDEAVIWLASKGQEGQWGTRPFSETRGEEKLVTKFEKDISGEGDEGKAWTAELNGSFAGFISVGTVRANYILKTEEEKDGKELFVKVLITNRKTAGKGVGPRLLDAARAYATHAHFDLMRVDCWRGPEGKQGLIGFYEAYGFRRLREFEVPAEETPSGKSWQGQLLEINLST